MGVILDDLYDHEGWPGRRLPDGTLTGTWTAATADFIAYRPQCSCGWVGHAEYPPNEAGEDAALEEWERSHARPLLDRQIPGDLAADLTALRKRLNDIVDERPLAALGQARRLVKWADVLSERAATRARERGSGWAEIGQAAETSAQAAQQRYGRIA